jgi:EAL domain-containing protein (putative c-di-GMP-specific phosphodiesterase class I)
MKLDEYCEILLRLQDETDQIILPGDFIPAAERYGLMHLVDRWVVRSLLVYLSHLQKKSVNFEGKPIKQRVYSINLSGSSINDDQFLDFVKEHLSVSKVPPQAICFEITETVAISNLDKAVQFMDQLKTFGCRFALDDFGSGMSSFGYLKKLPVDYLKIDGNFIRDLGKSKVAREIVESINRIGHVMGVETVAEFVESDSTLMELKAIGIDYAQGYGISRPFPLE